MTPKDIRDIAAYWGATYSYRNAQSGQEAFGQIDASALGMVPIGYVIKVVSGLKLHLRPLSSLTDEEAKALARLVLGQETPEINCVQRPSRGIRTSMPIGFSAENEKYSCDWWINEQGLFGGGEDDRDMGDSEWVHPNAMQGVAYLQSIGVYVPGTIDEQYVQLIEP